MQNLAITKRLEQLDSQYRDYILSGEPQVISKTFSEAHKLTPEKEIVLENGFALYLLFFINLSDFSNFIVTECKFSEAEANLLARAMHMSLPEFIRETHEQTSPLIFPNNSDEGEQIMLEIAETEAALETINPIRTMASDSKHVSPGETVHTSTQSAILN